MKTKILFFIIAFSLIFNTYAQWTEQNTNFQDASRGVNYVSIVDSNIVWASAYDGSGADPTATINEYTKTIDGGATWVVGNLSPDPGLRIAMIQGISADKAWAIGFKNSGTYNVGVWTTTDGGTSWSKQSSAPFNSSGSFPNVVHFWDENNGFCQGDPVDGYFELYTTNDGGLNWTRVPSDNIPTPLTGEYGYVSQIFTAGTRVWFTTNKGRIFRSDDQGLNWVAFQSPIPDFGGADSSGEISFWDNNNGMLINQDGAIFNSTDGGETWNGVFPNTGETFGSTITCIPDSNVVISSGQSHSVEERGSSFSINNGLDWTTIDTGIYNHLDTYFIDINTGWTSGFTSDTTPTTGGIFKYTGTELPASTNDNTITTFKAYPNPVKDILTIEGVDTISNVSIFNMLGQKVLNVNPNGNNANINMNSLNNGTYFAKVTINGATETMKIIK